MICHDHGMAKPCKSAMWYVIWAPARREKELISSIEQNVPADLYTRVWIPRRQEIRRYAGKEEITEMVLFPGYVFIDTSDPESVHQCLKHVKSYIRILGDGDIYSPVTGYEREIIEHFTGETGTAGISLGIITAGTLHILDGPLTGMESHITKIDRHRRKAYVRIDGLLGEDRILNFALEIVEKNA